jgi:protein-disulfide isomerase
MRTYRVRIPGLTSAPVPDLRPDDHVRGPDGAPLVVMYADFTCPRCAVAHERMRSAPLRVAFRHLALRAKHPRAIALAQASEAAAAQGAFWAFHDAVYADKGRIDDPHLWAHAASLGLDVERFERDRRSDAVAERVRRDTREAMRAGATATPTLFAQGEIHPGPPDAGWMRRMAPLSSSQIGQDDRSKTRGAESDGRP